MGLCWDWPQSDAGGRHRFSLLGFYQDTIVRNLVRPMYCKLIQFFILSSLLTCVSWAARVGLDNATNTNYPTAGTNIPINQLVNTGNVSGTPFGGWWFEGNGDWAIGTASQSTLGGGSTALDTGGKSLLLKGANIPAGAGGFTKASRYIDPNGLAAGQYFSFDLAVNFRNGYKGVDVFAVVGTDSVKVFNFNVGGDDYTINGTTIGNSYSSDSIFNIRFDQTSADGGSWTLTRSGGVSDIETGTYAGVIRNFSFYIGGTEASNENVLIVNNLKVGPYRQVNFAVDMRIKNSKNEFRPVDGHGLEIKGSFDEWGPGIALTDPDADNIYSATVLYPGAVGALGQYRLYASNTGTNGLTWEDRWSTWLATGGSSGGSHNRSLTFGADGSDQTIPTFYFGDDDGIGPVITRSGDAVINLQQNASYADAGANAVDFIEGNCEVTVSISPSATLSTLTQTPGTYTITYNSLDAAGNSGTPATRTVVVASAANDGYDAFIAGKTTNSQTLAEYAFGATDVGVLPSGNNPQVSASGGRLILTYYVRITNPALVVIPELSRNLIDGFAPDASIDSAVIGQISVGNVLLEQRTASVPVDSDCKFLRLKIQRGQ